MTYKTAEIIVKNALGYHEKLDLDHAEMAAVSAVKTIGTMIEQQGGELKSRQLISTIIYFAIENYRVKFPLD